MSTLLEQIKAILAMRGLASPLQMPTPRFAGQHYADADRKARRLANRLHGARQARRMRCRGYALKRAAQEVQQ